MLVVLCARYVVMALIMTMAIQACHYPLSRPAVKPFKSQGSTSQSPSTAASQTAPSYSTSNPSRGDTASRILETAERGADANVRDFGATGDGVTDDTLAIQAALLAASKGTLTFPNGRYLVSRRLTRQLAVSETLKIVGRGQATIISTIEEPESESGILDITGSKSASLEIENISVVHSAEQVGLLDGVYLRGGFKRVSLRNVSSLNASLWGIKIEGAVSGVVDACRADNNRYGGAGLFHCENISVTGGSYSYNGTTAPTDGYGIACATSTAGPNKNILIQGVQANWNKRKCIDVHSGHNIAINGNFVKGFGNAGVFAAGKSTSKDVKDIKITSNVIDGEGSTFAVYGIHAGAYDWPTQDSGSFTITGNTILNTEYPGSSAIYVQNPTKGIGPEKVVIANNAVKNGASSSSYIIRVHNGPVKFKDVLITDNTIHAKQCLVGIGSLNAERTTIIGNIVTIDSGTTAFGVTTSATDSSIIIGNNLAGAAVYTSPIRIFNTSSQTARSNVFKGSILPDTVAGGRTVGYGATPPATGHHFAGSIVYNESPEGGESAGWICTVTGSPGTWEAFGPIGLGSFRNATATLDFPTILPGSQQELTIPLAGAAIGDSVALGPPATLPPGVAATAYVSGPNAVTVRLSNFTASSLDPSSSVWRVSVLK